MPEGRLYTGVAALVAAHRRRLALEAELKAVKADIRFMETVSLPDLFGAEHAKKLEFDDDLVARLGISATGSIPKDPILRAAAISKAEEYGWGPSILTTVTAKWGRGDREKAQEEFNRLRALNSASVSIDETINHMTLGKLARDRIKAGGDTDTKVLGIEVLPRVKLQGLPKTEDEGETNDE